MSREKQTITAIPEQVYDDAQVQEKVFTLLRLHQDLDDMLRPEKPSAKIQVKNGTPFLIYSLSDVHLGSKAVDIDRLERVMKMVLTTENVFVVCLGDLIEGIREGRLDTTVAETPLNVTEQIKAIKALLHSLADKGKLLAIVGGYKGHDQWMNEFAQVSPGMILVDGMKVPVVENGGILNVEYDNGYVEHYKMMHNPGGGGSEINPVGSQRKRTEQENDIQIAAAGHNHSRGAVSKEVGINGETTIYEATGTFKGNSRKRKDRHYVRDFAGAITANTEAVTIHYSSPSTGIRDITPVANLLQGIELKAGIDSLNWSERHGFTQEIIDEARAKTHQLRPVISEKVEGRVSRETREDRTPHLKRIIYDLTGTAFPIQIVPFSGYRAGCSSALPDKLRELISTVKGNPFAYAVFLRHMIDAGISETEDRETIVREYIELIRPLANTDEIRSLGHLMSGSIREKGWSKPIRSLDDEGKKTQVEAFLPAKTIYEELNIPFLDNKSEIDLVFGDAHVLFFILDRLVRSGSFDDPYRGLVVNENRWMTGTKYAHNVIMGGHMPKAGVMTKFSPFVKGHQYFLAPGWLSQESDSAGLGNREPASPAGQSVIYDPVLNYIYMAATLTEGQTLFQATTVKRSVDLLGGPQKIMSNNRRKRSR